VDSNAATTDGSDVYVRQGPNHYEWHVYHTLGTKLATLVSQPEAAAFIQGYTMGLRHGAWSK